MLNNRWFVVGLCVAAIALVALRVVQPIMQELNGGDAPVMASDDPYADYDVGLDGDLDGPDLTSPAQSEQIVTAQRAIRSIDVDALHWQERPPRDPFSPATAVSASSVEAVLAISAVSRRMPTDIRWPRVSAVIDSRKHQYAVIDGSIRRPGDRFGEFILTAIERERIRLQHTPSQSTKQVKVEPQ